MTDDILTRQVSGTSDAPTASAMPQSKIELSPADRRNPRTREALLRRIANEFLEIPGLCLTLTQASRFFGMREDICQRLLTSLVDSKTVQYAGGYYGVWRSDFIGVNFLTQAIHRHYR